jgi:hypothetical protein|tara:strand:- start:626 stop:820 length:195 start_codon:yes stop_codon:yes gene_type:complete
MGAIYLEQIARLIETIERLAAELETVSKTVLANPPWHIDAVGGRSHHQILIRVKLHSTSVECSL